MRAWVNPTFSTLPICKLTPPFLMRTLICLRRKKLLLGPTTNCSASSRKGEFFHDAGGSGDCAFRAIAWNLSRAQGKQLSDEEALQSEAARLRLLSVGHLGKHASRFSESWAEDPAETKFRGSGAKTAFRDASGTPKSKRPPADKSSPVSRLSVPPATPSRDDVDGSGLSLPTSAPKMRKDGAFSLPTATPRRESLAKCAACSASAHRTASSKEVAIRAGLEGAIRFPSKPLLSTKKLLLLGTSLLMACYFKPSVKELLVGSSFGDGILVSQYPSATGLWLGTVMSRRLYCFRLRHALEGILHITCLGISVRSIGRSVPSVERRPEYFQKQSQSLRGTNILILARALAAWTEDAPHWGH